MASNKTDAATFVGEASLNSRGGSSADPFSGWMLRADLSLQYLTLLAIVATLDPKQRAKVLLHVEAGVETVLDTMNTRDSDAARKLAQAGASLIGDLRRIVGQRKPVGRSRRKTKKARG